MSIYNHFLLQKTPQGNKLNPNGLYLNGPMLNVIISLPKSLADLYSKTGLKIPQPKAGVALIDTGATKSCVHETIMAELGVKPIGMIISHTANGAKPSHLYPAHFTFPEARMEIDLTSVVEVDLRGQKFNERQIIALIGRDILSQSVLVYNGRLGLYTLAL